MVGRGFCSWNVVVSLGACVIGEEKFVIFVKFVANRLVGRNQNLVEIYLSDCLVCSISGLTDRGWALSNPKLL